jgi:AmmeMemoRadiSam system protein A
VLTETDIQQLRDVAWESINYGVSNGRSVISVDPTKYSPALQERASSFVTLRAGAALRGCMGRLEAETSLIEDVARNANNAAFHDPRFDPVHQEEIDGLDLKLSVLSKPEPFPVESEAELLERIRPGVDGIILKSGSRKATFLPAVWEMLSTPLEFIAQLKRKAGLPEDYWSDNIEIQRYRADEY